MKRKFLAFILLVTAGLSLSSCLDSTDNNTNIVYYHDTAITNFSLGKMDKLGKKKDGVSDSLLRGVVDGSKYSFTIDQAKHEIYNVDSLPVNTRIAAVLATISAKNSNYIQINYQKQEDVAEGEKNDSLVWYNSTDSIDFTKTKEKAIRVFAQDATAYADYTVKVNVHTQRPDTFIWQSLAKENAELAALCSMKAVSLGEQVVLFGQNVAGELKMYKSKNGGKEWEPVNTEANLGKNAAANVVVFDNSIYVFNPETHQLLKSMDAKNWTLVGTFASLKQLIGAGSRNLYAYSGDAEAMGISVSSDKGASWTAEQIDADAKYLPVSNINMSYSSIRSTKDAENVLLIGNRNSTEKTDTIAMVWNRTIDFTGNSNAGSKWNFVEYVNSQPYKMPKLDQLVIAKAEDSYIALGSDAKWYESIDGGLSWKVDTLVVMPKGDGSGPAYDKTKPFAFVKVKEPAVAPDATPYDTYIYWIINGGNVWKGRYNRDGWLRKD